MEFGTASISDPPRRYGSQVKCRSAFSCKSETFKFQTLYDDMEWSQEVGKYVRFVYDNSDRHTSERDRQNRDAFQTRLMKRGQAKRAGGPPV